ncbi:hypothetical protein JTB14_026176 [Gonioctena quinquepunctata]|nr:hypothetical protein JTB14_026176 [Gonioctena quinquepunctata]
MDPKDEARLSKLYDEVSTVDEHSDSEQSEPFEDVDGEFNVTDPPYSQVTLQKIAALKMRPLKMQYSISLLMQSPYATKLIHSGHDCFSSSAFK